jgi:ribosomal protein L29
MAKLEAKDLREKTVVELQQHLLKDTRKNIARVKTLISEKAGL